MPLPRPGPTTLLGDPGYELDLLLDEYADEIEATSAAVAGKLDATDAALGSAIAAASSKTNPVDADSLVLADSAASNTAKRISWANIKSAISTALDGVFAKLAGFAGGQTITGGTAASEALTLRSTAHATKGKILLGSGAAYDEPTTRLGVGTQSPAAELHALATTEQLRLGYDASTYYSTTVSASGAVTHDATGQQHTIKGGSGIATLSANLLSNGDFASGLIAWTDSGSSWSAPSGAALHTAGSASTLSQSFATTAGTVYVLRFTISGRTAGSITLSLGSDGVYNSTSSGFSSNATFKRPVLASGASSLGLVITPTSDFNGQIDDVQVYAVTPSSVVPAIKVQDSTGAGQTIEIRPSAASQSNTAIGYNCHRSIVGGTGNTSIGYDAGRMLTDGISNVLIGLSTGQNGLNQNACTFVGSLSGLNLVNPAYVVALGYNAARYLSDGATAFTIANASTYIGYNTKASADSVTNENVFGYSATGIGSNSCVIGSSSVTKCQIFGDLILDKTVTAAGTTGAQTINKTVGSVNFAAGASSLVVTNSRVTTSSIIVATVATNDATLKSVVAVAAAGSFTLTANAAATAETRVNFAVFN